jgi:hypothetical protein
MGWDGMGYHLVAAHCCTTANGLWQCLCSVGHPSARVCTRTSGVWLHVSMELVIGRIIWVEGCVDAFQVDGQFRRAITGGTCIHVL